MSEVGFVRWAVSGGAVFAAVLVLSSWSGAQVLEPQPWTVETGGRVLAMARSGDTLYVGGNFRMVGPSSGQGVPVSLETGEPSGSFPQVVGVVWAAVGDGEGGWFIGGTFVGVGGQPREHLAHILADGSVSAWAPNPDGMVRTLVLSGGRLYVGGDFGNVAGTARGGLAAFEVASERLSSWHPDLQPRTYRGVLAIAVRGHSVYVGGDFKAFGGQVRRYIAEVDDRSGRISDWDPAPDWYVNALTVQGNTLYVGGHFSRVGGQPREHLAALDLSTGGLLPWRWKVERIPDDPRYDDGPYVGVLVAHGNTLLVGGSFTHVDGAEHGGVAALDLRTHAFTEWNPGLAYYNAPSPYCYSLAVRGGVVYVAGEFVRMGGMQRLYAGAADAKTGELLAWDPRPNAEVRALAVSDHSVYLGGAFSSLWSWKPRNYLAALDVRTGEPLPWNPNPNSLVDQMLLSGRTLYVSGAFDKIAGQSRRQLAALDAVSGEVTSWNPGVSAYTSQAISAMVMSRGTLYLGGWFYKAGGQLRDNLAAIDSVSGTATPWNPGANDEVLSLALHRDTIFVGGWFDWIGGAKRRCLAAVDVSTGTALPWRADTDGGWVGSLAVGDRALYAGGVFKTIGGAPRVGLAALNLESGAVLPWRADTDPRVLRVAVSRGVVYASGWFTTVGGQERYTVAALDDESGAVLPWDPEVRGEPQPALRSTSVAWCLLPWENTLYVGGSFDRVGLLPGCGLAWLRDAAGEMVDQHRFARPLTGSLSREFSAEISPNPVHSSGLIRYALPRTAQVTLGVYDLQGRCIAKLLDHAQLPAGEHELGLRTGSWAPGCYLFRLEADGAALSRKVIVVQ